jgi:hypothetical protein
MTVVELKNKLIGKIKRTENSEILEDLIRLFDIEDSELPAYELSVEQKTAISEAREQYSKGKVLTSEQAEKEIGEWLGE